MWEKTSDIKELLSSPVKDGCDVLESDMTSLVSINKCMQRGLGQAVMALQVLHATGKSFHRTSRKLMGATMSNCLAMHGILLI
jgi:hypothetical protein